MRKDVNDYKLYVFDLDGTLYDQPRLRTVMAIKLIGYYLLHPFSIGDMFILKHFRHVKEGWTKSSSEADIIKKVSEDKHTDEKRIEAIVRKWIYEVPLDIIKATRDANLIEWMERLRLQGKRVVILSDYPAKEKLLALNVTVDGMYDPDDERVDALKPSPKGLEVIMSDEGVDPAEILMIGDRMEKDGLCAKAAGVDHLILPRKIKNRDYEKYER